MNVEKELEEMLDAQSQWKGAPDRMWQRVESEIHRRQGRRKWSVPAWAAVAVAAVAMGVFFVQTNRGPVQPAPPIVSVPNPARSTQSPSAGRAIILRTMAGTVDKIQGGSLTLRDVTYSRSVGDPKPEPRVSVPAGRWISQTHWQSDDGSLDLFRGQPVTYFLDQKTILPGTQPGHGIVQQVNGDTMELEVNDGDSGKPLTWHKVAVQTFKLSPQSQRGDHGASPGRTLKPGDKVLVLWYGEPDYQVVWQYTFLP